MATVRQADERRLKQRAPVGLTVERRRTRGAHVRVCARACARACARCVCALGVAWQSCRGAVSGGGAAWLDDRSGPAWRLWLKLNAIGAAPPLTGCGTTTTGHPLSYSALALWVGVHSSRERTRTSLVRGSTAASGCPPHSTSARATKRVAKPKRRTYIEPWPTRGPWELAYTTPFDTTARETTPPSIGCAQSKANFGSAGPKAAPHAVSAAMVAHISPSLAAHAAAPWRRHTWAALQPQIAAAKGSFPFSGKARF